MRRKPLSKNPFKIKPLSYVIQNGHIQKKFPHFKLTKNGNEIFWIGTLKPTNASKLYTVKILFKSNGSKVYIINPKIVKRAPHVYTNGSLCLHYPADKDYNAQKIIALTLIPWTCEWLYFYEEWLKSGIWWGKEALHATNTNK